MQNVIVFLVSVVVGATITTVAMRVGMKVARRG